MTLAGCKPRQSKTKDYKYLVHNDKPADKPVVKDDKPSTKDDVAEDSGRPTSSAVRSVIKKAETFLGTPYRYGGINKNGIDCSALTLNAYRSIGVDLPRSSKAQSGYGLPIKRARLKPGDLIFFTAKNNGKIDHVGMVTKVINKEVTFIHATTSKGVRYDRLDVGYWTNLFVEARRPGTH